MTEAALPPQSHKAVRLFFERLRAHLADTPKRVRQSEFWYVQSLAAAAIGTHYGIQLSGVHTPYNVLHMGAVALVVAPMLVAALWFGWPGAVFTALEIAILTLPSTFIWHGAVEQWLTEGIQLLITLPVGLLVAWRIGREEVLREDAERTSEGLTLLNQVAAMTRRSGDDQVYLLNTVRAIRDHLGAEFAWIVLDQGGERRVVTSDASPSGPPSSDVVRTALDFHESTMGDGYQTIQQRGYWLREIGSDEGVVGSLGLFTSEESMLTGEQQRLLDTVASQVGTSIEIAELFRLRQSDLRTYIKEITRAQEAERLRLARDLHDDTMQELTEVVRRIDSLPQVEPETIAAEAHDVAEAARGALNSLRAQAQRLRPPLLDEVGIVGGLGSLVSEAEKTLTDGLVFAVSGQERRLGDEMELALYRITQEALANIRKHSGATSASVQISFEPAAVALTITDNGEGFQVPGSLREGVRSGHLGIAGMAERVEALGGTLQMTSATLDQSTAEHLSHRLQRDQWYFEGQRGKARGTTVSVTVPTDDTSAPPAGHQNHID